MARLPIHFPSASLCLSFTCSSPSFSLAITPDRQAATGNKAIRLWCSAQPRFKHFNLFDAIASDGTAPAALPGLPAMGQAKLRMNFPDMPNAESVDEHGRETRERDVGERLIMYRASPRHFSDTVVLDHSWQWVSLALVFIAHSLLHVWIFVYSFMPLCWTASREINSRSFN